jgi:hypothetical protein
MQQEMHRDSKILLNYPPQERPPITVHLKSGLTRWVTIFRKTPPSVVSGYGKLSINLDKVVATFEKHIFLSQTDLTRTGIISNSYNEMVMSYY